MNSRELLGISSSSDSDDQGGKSASSSADEAVARARSARRAKRAAGPSHLLAAAASSVAASASSSPSSAPSDDSEDSDVEEMPNEKKLNKTSKEDTQGTRSAVTASPSPSKLTRIEKSTPERSGDDGGKSALVKLAAVHRQTKSASTSASLSDSENDTSQKSEYSVDLDAEGLGMKGEEDSSELESDDDSAAAAADEEYLLRMRKAGKDWRYFVADDNADRSRSAGCFLCGREGHLARDCPNAVCLKCHIPGHMARACFEDRYVAPSLRQCCGDGEGVPESQDSCYRCGLAGHRGDRCSIVQDTDSFVRVHNSYFRAHDSRGSSRDASGAHIFRSSVERLYRGQGHRRQDHFEEARARVFDRRARTPDANWRRMSERQVRAAPSSARKRHRRLST